MDIDNIYHLVLDHYAIGDPNIQWVRGVGEESRLYRICAESGSYALKVRPVEDELSDKLEQGASAALHLQSKGFHATPSPVPCRNGSLVARHGGAIAVLYAWVDGYSVRMGDDARTMKQIGIAYAQFHQASSGFGNWIKPPSAESLLLRIEELREFIQEAPICLPKGILRSELEAVLVRARAFMDSWADYFTSAANSASQLYRATADGGGFVHGDTSLSNILLDTDGAVHIVDLDNIVQETRWWDLGGLGLRLIQNPDSIRNLLRGYDSICPLGNLDYDALPILENPIEDLVWEMEVWAKRDCEITGRVSRFRRRYIDGPGPFDLYELLREEVGYLAEKNKGP